MKRLSTMFPTLIGVCSLALAGCTGRESTGLSQRGVHEGGEDQQPVEAHMEGDEDLCAELQSTLEACFQEAEASCDPGDFDCVSGCFQLKEEFARQCMVEEPPPPDLPPFEIGACDALHIALEACFRDGCEARCQIIQEAIFRACEAPELCCGGHDRPVGVWEKGREGGEMEKNPPPGEPDNGEPEQPGEMGP